MRKRKNISECVHELQGPIHHTLDAQMQMEPVMTVSIKLACEQHQRICAQICVLTFCVDWAQRNCDSTSCLERGQHLDTHHVNDESRFCDGRDELICRHHLLLLRTEENTLFQEQ